MTAAGRFRINPGIAWVDRDDRIVALDLRIADTMPVPMTLAGGAANIWRELEQWRDLESVSAAVALEVGMAASEVVADVRTTVDELVRHRLVDAE